MRALPGFLVLFFSAAVLAADIPRLPELHPETAAARPELANKRESLVKERSDLRERSRKQESECGEVEADTEADRRCTGTLEALTGDVERHIRSSEEFVEAAEKAETVRIMGHMNAFTARLGWSPDERDRTEKALNALGFDGDPDATQTLIRRAWQDVLSRGSSEEFSRGAAAGEGPGLPGAGKQSHEDCAVFALANAAGLPYGVAAARAAELIREAEWRDPSERKDPQKAIEDRGLMGGEVILLAEAFGRAEVIPGKDFVKTLKEGRPVMVNVIPPSGDFAAGHEIVLTKTFRRGDETWYEMIDSNQEGPGQRLYLSARELDMILKENGVAFRPEAGTTVQLLR